MTPTVGASLVTRGDVDMRAVTTRIREAGVDRIVIYDNGHGIVSVFDQDDQLTQIFDAPNLAVFGRYAAIRYLGTELVYVQDDDCMLPVDSIRELVSAATPGTVTMNMPARFRRWYTDSGLVGFGSVFDPAVVTSAFARFAPAAAAEADADPTGTTFASLFLRRCDVVFTALSPMQWLDVPYENLPWATAPGRAYRQPNHVKERRRMLAAAREMRG